MPGFAGLPCEEWIESSFVMEKNNIVAQGGSRSQIRKQATNEPFYRYGSEKHLILLISAQVV